MIVYHASPNDKIKKLYDKSYVTILPHIAYYITWTNNDLKNLMDLKQKYISKKEENLLQNQLYIN